MENKDLTPSMKGGRSYAKNKEKRIKRAAGMSHSKSATEIMTELDITKRTLQRYMRDPLWKEYDGKPLTFAERGRPTRTTLSRTEKQRLAEAHALHKQGHKWLEVAELMPLPIRRLKYLLKKERETETDGQTT